MQIYKIFRAQEFAAFESAGKTAGAPVDLADGFIHFSTADQVAETAAKHFAGEDDLVLLALNGEALGEALKWEPSRGGALFPHLYREMTKADVQWVQPMPIGTDGIHTLPEDLE